MRIVLISFLFGAYVHAATCCLGGGPKSFISLQRLEKYQIGLSTGVRDVFAHYNIYGELEESPKNQTITAALGVGVRIFDPLQLSVMVPFVYQQNQVGPSIATRKNLGDTFAGFQYTIIESLFQSDKYPTVAIQAGVKFPTGAVESSTSGNVRGTGNGLWEPTMGLLLQKNYSILSGSVRAAFTKRVPTAKITDREGDLIELNETLALNFTQRLSVAAGLGQAWTRAGYQNGVEIPDTHSRIISALFSATYFVTRQASLTAAFESALPVEAWGMNQQAYRSFSLTARFGFI